MQSQDILGLFNSLNNSFPPPLLCSHSITFGEAQQSLILCIWVGNSNKAFYVEDEELLNPSQLIAEVQTLLSADPTNDQFELTGSQGQHFADEQNALGKKLTSDMDNSTTR